MNFIPLTPNDHIAIILFERISCILIITQRFSSFFFHLSFFFILLRDLFSVSDTLLLRSLWRARWLSLWSLDRRLVRNSWSLTLAFFILLRCCSLRSRFFAFVLTWLSLRLILGLRLGLSLRFWLGLGLWLGLSLRWSRRLWLRLWLTFLWRVCSLWLWVRWLCRLWLRIGRLRLGRSRLRTRLRIRRFRIWIWLRLRLRRRCLWWFCMSLKWWVWWVWILFRRVDFWSVLDTAVCYSFAFGATTFNWG